MRRRRNHSVGMAAGILLGLFALTLAAEAAGPFRIELRQGVLEAELLRVEGNMVWIRRKLQGGQTYDSGIKFSDFIRVYAPWPPQFDQVELADTPEKRARLQKQLAYYITTFRDFRKLPGIRVEEAMIRNGQLLEQREQWDKALETYQSVLEGDVPEAAAAQARLRSGICRAKMGEDEAALADLDKDLVPADDTALLSQVCFARGDAFRRLERYDEAILEYLYPVVFMPFTGDNEVRGLGAAMECYVDIEDWRSLKETIDELKTRYPDSDAAERADEIVEEYAASLSAEQDFQVDYEETMQEEGE